MGAVAFKRPVLDVQQRRARLQLRHFRRHVHRAEVGGPVGVHLEQHIRTPLRDVVHAQLAADLLELPPMVVQKEVDAVRRKPGHEAVHRLGGTPHRIHVREIRGREPGRRTVQPKRLRRLHHVAERRAVRPRRMARRHRHAESLDLRLEVLRALAEEVERLHALVANGRHALEHAVEVLRALVAQGIELDADGLHDSLLWNRARPCRPPEAPCVWPMQSRMNVSIPDEELDRV